MKLTCRKCLKQTRLYVVRSCNDKRKRDAGLCRACSSTFPGLVGQAGASWKIRRAFLLAAVNKSADTLRREEKLAMRNRTGQQYSMTFRCLALVLRGAIGDIR